MYLSKVGDCDSEIWLILWDLGSGSLTKMVCVGRVWLICFLLGFSFSFLSNKLSDIIGMVVFFSVLHRK